MIAFLQQDIDRKIYVRYKENPSTLQMGDIIMRRLHWTGALLVMLTISGCSQSPIKPQTPTAIEPMILVVVNASTENDLIRVISHDEREDFGWRLFEAPGLQKYSVFSRYYQIQIRRNTNERQFVADIDIELNEYRHDARYGLLTADAVLIWGPGASFQP